MSEGDEGGADRYVCFLVVAYQLAGSDGWCLAETAMSLEEFHAALMREGKAVAALRQISGGLRREGFQAPGLGLLFIHNWGWTFDERADCWRAPGENILPPLSRSERVDSVRIEFGRPDCGWLPILIAAGNQEISFRASEVYCPFPSILDWFEKLIEGEYGRIVADLEGREAEFFSFATADPARARIVATLSRSPDTDEYRKTCLDIDIDSRLFARTFYASLRAYAESPLFDFTEWAAIPMHEDLAERGFGRSAAELASFSRAELNAWLWKLYPAYYLDPHCVQRVEGEAGEAPDPHRTPYYVFKIPSEYDGWDFSRRADYIAELLQENVNSPGGTDLRKLRSQKLQALLP
jgi:hypothetical protein